MKIEEFCKTSNQTEMINLFDNLSKSVVKQHRKVLKSSEKELMTKVANKKQMDTLYANSFNDIRVYNTLLNDLKILVKQMI
jgi:16S rRNA A1518/A1519 N6-dimethyltransferase RsmA/KsgA/DIM1 with predicted DNA glycosylase/AP lyase activity